MGDEQNLTGLSGNSSIGVSNMEVDSIVRRIMNLSIEQIDELWSSSGWVDEEAKKDNRKGLPYWRLEKIKNDKIFAEESFVMFVTDEPYYELRNAAVFLQNLDKIGGRR